MLSYGHRRFGLTCVIATVAPVNVASRRVLAKAGMRALGPRANDDGSFTQAFVWEQRDG